MQIDCCDRCHVELTDGAHYSAKERRVLCRECHEGCRLPVAMPCTPEQCKQIELWMRPLARQTPQHGPATQPRGHSGQSQNPARIQL
jgi:recombinational DNA repair protein (RecF pathway)